MIIRNNFFAFLFYICVSKGSEIISPESIKGEILTYDALLGPNPNNISGEVILASPYVACSELDTSTNFTNKVVIVGPDRCLPQEKVDQAIKAGALAVLVEQYRNTHGLLRFYQNGRSDFFNVSVLEISSKNVEAIKNSLDSNKIVFVKLGINPNPITTKTSKGIWIFFTVFHAIYDLFLICLISSKLWMFYQSELKVSKLSISVLVFDLIICFLRIPILIDPTGLLGVHKWNTIEHFMTIDYGLTVVSTLGLVFIWDATYRHAMDFNKNIKKFKIYIFLAVIASISLIFLEIGSNFMRALLLSFKSLLIATVFLYSILGISTFIYLLFTAKKLLNMLAERGDDIRKSSRYRSMSRNIIACSIFLLLFALNIWLVITPLYTGPEGYFIIRFMISFWIYNITLTHILLFKSPNKNKTYTIKNMNTEGSSIIRNEWDWVGTCESVTESSVTESSIAESSGDTFIDEELLAGSVSVSSVSDD